jgi:hypothetical protein
MYTRITQNNAQAAGISTTATYEILKYENLFKIKIRNIYRNIPAKDLHYNFIINF